MSVTAVPQSTASSTSVPASSSTPQTKTLSAAAAQPHAQLQSQVNMHMENERGPESRKEMEKQRDLVVSKDGHQTPPSGLKESVQHTHKGKSNLINFSYKFAFKLRCILVTVKLYIEVMSNN